MNSINYLAESEKPFLNRVGEIFKKQNYGSNRNKCQ